MQYALHIPNFGSYGDPRLLADLAREAEGAGWDGFFLWDHVFWRVPATQLVADPWVALTAMAMVTSRIRLGTLITPLARRRPWTVARQATTLDHLSGGRVVLGAGIGGDWFGDYSTFDEPAGDKLHGEMLDEALEIIAGLWSGEPFSYEGRHYKVRNAHFLPRPLQQPRIPIWVAGNWPNRKPFRRTARWDGVAPEPRNGYGDLQPQDFAEMRSYIAENRSAGAPFDITHVGYTSGDDPAAAAATLAPYAKAGVTWWLERITDWRGPLEEMRTRIRQGPPRPA